jgi:hypothetical protein
LRASLIVGVVVVALAAVGAIGYVFYHQPSETALVAQPTEAPVTISEIPLTTKIVKVAGKLPAKAKAKAEMQIDELLTRYVSAGYLGVYPRSSFSDTYSLMDPNLVKFASKDADVIAGKQWATQSVSVDPGTLVARISLLAVNKKPVGGTAKINWAFQVTALTPDESSSGAVAPADSGSTAATASTSTTAEPTTVTIKGQILLAMGKSGWQIFGYDATAPDVTGGSGQ